MTQRNKTIKTSAVRANATSPSSRNNAVNPLMPCPLLPYGYSYEASCVRPG